MSRLTMITRLGGALIISSVLLLGCGGGQSGPSLGGTVPVQAASGYTTATLSGTYGISFVGRNASDLEGDGVGTITFDGNGNITGGTVTTYSGLAQSCAATMSGTYPVAATGSIQATINSTSTDSSCTGGSSTFSGEIGSNGAAAVFAESDGSGGTLSGTAIKQ